MAAFELILLSLICVFLIAHTVVSVISLSYNALYYKSAKEVQPFIEDLKRASTDWDQSIKKLKNIQRNHAKYILRCFKIMRDSIEQDMTPEQTLKMINELNLPLDNEKEKEI